MSFNLENPEVDYHNIGESTKNLFSLSWIDLLDHNIAISMQGVFL